MSLGTKAIRSCIEHGSVSVFRNLEERLFTEPELPLYQWVRAFVAEHRQMPTRETVTAQGLSLDRAAPEPPAFYAEELRRRCLFIKIGEGSPALRQAMEDRNLNAAVEALRGMLQGAAAVMNPTAFAAIGDLAQQVVEDYQEAKAHPGLRGVTLGYPTLDELTLGAQGGDLVVVSGRTGMGKSWLLVRMAHAAWREGNTVGVVSMEMGLVPLARRWVGLHTRINPNLIRAGQLSPIAEQRLVQQAMEIGQETVNRAFFLSGDFSKRVGQVERMLDENELDVLYIDAAYLLTPEGQKKGYVTRWESIAGVIAELKHLALKTNRPIVLTVQMNRQVSKRTTRQLDTTDIGGSDSIPQDASIILGMRQGPSPYETIRRTIELMKNRDGEEAVLNIYYGFNPVNLDEAPPPETGGGVDVSWM